MSRRGRRRAPFRLKLRTDILYSVAAILLIGSGCLVILSFSRQTWILQIINRELVKYTGWTAFLMSFIFMAAGLMLTRLRWRITRPNVLVGGILMIISLAAITKSGVLGREVWQNISTLITGLGAGLIFSGLILIGFMIMTETPFDELLLKVFNGWKKRRERIGIIKEEQLKGNWMSNLGGKKKILTGEKRDEKEIMAKREIELALESQIPKGDSQMIANFDGATNVIWKYPSLSLLKESLGGKADRGDVKKNADTIEQTLESFGIKARVVDISYGPAVTQYALEIAIGTKLAKITTLQNDLALALAAPTGQIRIEAPIPGKNLVGIEVPNRSPEFVTLRKILSSKEMKQHPSKLAVGLGLNVSNQPIITDITEMPHVLIAGATGSGKSVAINSFLCSILFRASPEEVKIILVDPKRVELTGYNGIPHLLTPVIVEPAQVISALKWAEKEMERRYKIFSEVGARNITAFNEQSGFQAMPYILIVIDELADIMLFAPSEVEECVTRIAQMARATGIHLVIATQRPSTDVITGLIKANIPCRISFNVTSMVDSRVIIDAPGAEKLLGRGDMLYVPPTQAKPTRIQGTYVSDGEIDQIMGFLRQQGVRPQYNEAVTEKFQIGKAQPGAITDEAGKDVDTLFDEAVKIVTRHDRASASLLQRRLSIGYARAARILDQLQHHQIVGPAEGSKPREVLIRDADGFLSRLHSGDKL